MAREIFNRVVCILTVLMLQSRIHIFAFPCGRQNFSETLRIQDNSSANISDGFNITKDSGFADIYYDVCESNSLRPHCRFRWNQQFNNMTVILLNKTGGAICSAASRDLGMSMSTVQLHISQPVTRSIGLTELSYTGVKDRSSRTILFDVLYPPNITSFTVDGHEVSGNHLINESQAVTVSCLFDKGNPPTDFRLTGTNGTTLNSSKNDEHNISHTFKVRCEDEWPIVGCEGIESAQNRYVSFLVNCLPQFINNSQTELGVPQSDVITLRIKSHTTAVSGCLLTPMSSGDNTTMNVKCTVSGDPPEFLLNLHLGQKNSSMHGNWTFTVCNDKGSANITLNIISRLSDSGPGQESGQGPESVSEPKENSELYTYVLGSGAVLIVLTVAVVAVFAIKKVKGKKHGATVRALRGANEDRRPGEGEGESMLTMTVNDFYETSGGRIAATSNTQDHESPSQTYMSAADVREKKKMKRTTEDHGSHSQTYMSAADVRKKKKIKRTGNPPSEADINTYVSAPEVREKKRLKKPGSDARAAQTNDSVLAPKATGTSGLRNADGLIYGDLDFTDQRRHDVMHSSASETVYAQINTTAIVPPPRDYKQKTGKKV